LCPGHTLPDTDMTTANFVRQAAWYRNSVPTFIDAPAGVRRHLWGHVLCCTSPVRDGMVEAPRILVESPSPRVFRVSIAGPGSQELQRRRGVCGGCAAVVNVALQSMHTPG
jgi:hypothetical protein